jgi:polyhydroxyalkanoate synthesis repressor PhaR
MPGTSRSETGEAMTILIKRYANRKLYNTKTSRYITLKGIADLIDQGEKVQVIDNESGEDITSISLSQILVDSERSNSSLPQTLLTQLLERGGDALYTALRKGVDDATEGIEEFQERIRRMVHFDEFGAPTGRSSSDGERAERTPHASEDSGPRATPARNAELEAAVEHAVEVALAKLDLPSRADIAALNRSLERIAAISEKLTKPS